MGGVSRSSLRGLTLFLCCAAAVFFVAFDGGSYGLINRTTLAIGVWGAILLLVGLGVAPVERVPRAAVSVALLLAGLAAWTAASAGWAESAERAVWELARVVLFLGVFVLVALLATRGRAGAWSAGAATGIGCVALVALVSRFFPDLFPGGTVELLLGARTPRLSYPLDYWNGLGILTAMAVPLVLEIAVSRRLTPVRGLALGTLPALAVVVFLTSSRGAVAVAGAGIAVLVALDHRRWQVVGAVLVSALGAAAAVAALRTHRDLVDAPLTQAAHDQGPVAAFQLLVVCVLTGTVWGALVALAPRIHRRPPRLARQLAVLALAALVVAGIYAARPLQRFEELRRAPELPTQTDSRGPIEGHLLDPSGSGRWQQWALAVDQFEAHPLGGGGAGSFQAWATRYRGSAQFTTEAHSLYLETLGELGLVGFLLLAAAIGLALVTGLRRAWRERRSDAPTAALAAAAVGYAVGAGVDWMWELTAVTFVGVGILALVTGAATARESGPAPRLKRAVRIGAVAVGMVAIAIEAVPMLAELDLRRSQAAAADGNVAAALSAARAASTIEPWAASPYLQQALVHEEAGDLERAQEAIGRALQRDGSDWRMWFISARIETKLGSVAVAQRHLARARELNPESPLLAPAGSGNLEP